MVSSRADCDVLIVGGGISGLATGALLADAGKKVLVFEKEAKIGGRMSSTTYKGQPMDNTPHFPTGAGYLEDIFAKLGKPFPKSPITTYTTEVYQDGKWVNILDIVNRKDLRRMIGEIVTSSYEELEKYDDVPLKDWVSARTQDEGVHIFFRLIHIGAYGGSDYGAYAAGEFLLSQKEVLERQQGDLRKSWSYVDGGTAVTSGTLCEAIKERGGEIRTSSPVTYIIIEDGQARGVEVEVGNKLVPSHIVEAEVIRAPVVVCTLPLWDLFKVISPDDLPSWYAEWVENVKHKTSQVLMIEYAVERPLEGWEDVTAVKFMLPEDTLSGLAVVGNYTPYGSAVTEPRLAFYYLGLYNEMFNVLELDKAQNRKEMHRLFKLLETDVEKLAPNLKEQALRKTYHAGIFSIAAEVGLKGRGLPPMQPPGVKNLYLVSDTIREARGVGTQSCAHAAKICVDRILAGG